METQSDFLKRLYQSNIADPCYLPKAADCHDFVAGLKEFLFPPEIPNTFDKYVEQFAANEALLCKILNTLKCRMNNPTSEILQGFYGSLPDIYDKLMLDAEAVYRFDPAATSLQEVIHAYPGFFAICVHRIAHRLAQLSVPALPRIIAEYAHSKTGIDIHPGATIGESFFIDHGTGIVIGETTQIGNHVKLYQGVTLGALVVEKSLATSKRHPTIEDHVTIYAGSTVLGGQTVIGHHSVIGGNVWITESVAPFSTIVRSSGAHVHSKKKSLPKEELNKPLNENNHESK